MGATHSSRRSPGFLERRPTLSGPIYSDPNFTPIQFYSGLILLWSNFTPVQFYQNPAFTRSCPPTLASREFATWSAIASDDVSPGDSIPNRLISPATPWSPWPLDQESWDATSGGTILGRMPE